MGTRRNYTQSVLLLVRLRLKGAGTEQVEWRGKVQRVIDGESHEFNSLQALIDVLQAMLLQNERR